jgi:hypothetical protein
MLVFFTFWGTLGHGISPAPQSLRGPYLRYSSKRRDDMNSLY